MVGKVHLMVWTLVGNLRGPQGPDSTVPGQDGEKGLNWRGPYRKGVTYQPDDAVESAGSSYVATSTTRVRPPNATWDLLAQKGEPGAPGRGSGAHGGGGVTVQDEGVVLGSVTTENFVGAGVTVTQSGNTATITIPGGGGGSSLTVLDEGVVLDTAVSSIDIVGNLTATNVGHAVTITAPADLVTSVNGQQGVVVLDATDVGAVPGPQVVFVQSSDPGAVGAGALWVDTTTPGTSDQRVWKRDAANAAWANLLANYNVDEGMVLTDEYGSTIAQSSSINLTAAPGAAGVSGGGLLLNAGTGDAGASQGAFIVLNPGSADGLTQGSVSVGASDINFTASPSGLAVGSGGASLVTADANFALIATSPTDVEFIYADGVSGGGSLTIDAAGVHLTDESSSTGSAGQVLTAQGDTTALWASLPAWTETEVDFGTTPVWSKTFTVTAAAVTGASKIVVNPSGNVATGRTGNDLEWDNLLLGALPGTGSFTLTALAVPGPIVGPRKVFYQVS